VDSEHAELTKFVVPVTALLSFISFWRAASIVLCDLGSSAYYVGGIAEKAVGKAAPWFVLGIMLFSYAVRAVYIESCSMFVRGGVYKVVREAMGGTAAKFSVSALLFDYVLTGPISAVSAGLYLAGLINESATTFQVSWMRVPAPWFAAGFAILVTLYFWYTNRVGIPFSSTKALRIMQITAVMVVLLIGWCMVTIFAKGYQSVPPPLPANLHFSDEALGWLKGTAATRLAFIAILIGLGHSLLAMSGEESLAQVYREIEAPKHKNLIRTGFVIFVFSLLFTSLVSFFAVMLIPDSERSKYFDNLISGVSMFLVGPFALKLGFHALVVLVGVLILSGAVNTSIIGANGVLNRVAEDGVLPAWFRDPHSKHGTTYRIINLIIVLQLATIVFSHGDLYMLGEAYAFGVVWSFAMKALGVVVLRFKEPEVPRWKVPGNLRLMGKEFPAGLISITIILFLLACINVLTKRVATIAGTTFTIILFLAFMLCERHYKSRKNENQARKRAGKAEEAEKERFRYETREGLSPKSLDVRSGNTLVAVHDPNELQHLQKALAENDPAKSDVIVLSVNTSVSQDAHGKFAKQVMDECETRVFSKVIHAAEEVGKPVSMFAVLGKHPYDMILQAAQKLRSSRIFIDQSSRVSRDSQEQSLLAALERLEPPRPIVSVEIVPKNEKETSHRFILGLPLRGRPN
jgi:amino acid transporter